MLICILSIMIKFIDAYWHFVNFGQAYWWLFAFCQLWSNLLMLISILSIMVNSINGCWPSIGLYLRRFCALMLAYARIEWLLTLSSVFLLRSHACLWLWLQFVLCAWILFTRSRILLHFSSPSFHLFFLFFFFTIRSLSYQHGCLLLTVLLHSHTHTTVIVRYISGVTALGLSVLIRHSFD